MFKIGNKGFQVTFYNGFTVSVQFGTANYCTNWDCSVLGNAERDESVDAEIAIWNKNNRSVNFGHDTVRGYVNPDQVGSVMGIVATAKSFLEMEDAVNSFFQKEDEKNQLKTQRGVMVKKIEEMSREELIQALKEAKERF